MTDKTPMTIVYDGECPFCSNYVAMARLQDRFEVTLLDARTSPEVVHKYQAQGYDLSEGMIVAFPGVVHYGADALVAISLASSGQGLFNFMMSKVFKFPTVAKLLYPSMKLGRRLTLMALGRSPNFSTK